MTMLHIDTEKRVQMDLKSVIGESIAVLGIKGSGKTNTSAVIIEELLEHGLPLVIVDIEGEYWGLCERYEIVVVGKSPNVDIEAGVEQAAGFAEFAVTHGVSLILDVSEFDADTMNGFLLAFFNALWIAEFSARRPFHVVLEEAHEFVPQGVRSPLKELFTRIALRGRKRGLGLISISQRSAKVEKDVLTQAAIVFLHRVVHPIDIKVYQDILPLPPREVETMLGGLKPGDAIVLLNHATQVVHIRLRYTYHAGSTPTLDADARPRLRAVNKGLLEQLKALQPLSDSVIAKRTSMEVVDRIAPTRAGNERDSRVAQLEKENASLRKQVAELTQQTETRDKRPTSPKSRRKQIPIPEAETVTVYETIPPDLKRSITNITDDSWGLVQQRRFSTLIRDMQQLPRLHRVLLIYLIRREETLFTPNDLAKALNVRPATLASRPPTDLIRLGMISRNGSRGNFRYRSSARGAIKRLFPALDADLLLDRIVEALQPTGTD